MSERDRIQATINILCKLMINTCSNSIDDVIRVVKGNRKKNVNNCILYVYDSIVDLISENQLVPQYVDKADMFELCGKNCMEMFSNELVAKSKDTCMVFICVFDEFNSSLKWLCWGGLIIIDSEGKPFVSVSYPDYTDSGAFKARMWMRKYRLRCSNPGCNAMKVFNCSSCNQTRYCSSKCFLEHLSIHTNEECQSTAVVIHLMQSLIAFLNK